MLRCIRNPITRRLAAAALLAIALATACGGDGEQSVEGVIIEVEASSLTSIESFTLRTNDGETLMFGVTPEATQDPQEGFFPGHLRSHATLVEQVEVVYREEDGRLLALQVLHE